MNLDSARRAFDTGDLDTAVEAAEKALAAAAGQPEAVLMLVRALVYRSYTDWNRELDRTRALEIANSALLRGTGNPDALAAQACVGWPVREVGGRRPFAGNTPQQPRP